jgi:N6-L-threonylcarbamoyladenine synthase
MATKVILGIETSCDDTSICLIKGNPDDLSTFPEVISLLSFSSEAILARWGGIVPEIASRNHLEKLTPLLDGVFQESKLKLSDVDSFAVTTHPGLLGPLLTGLNMAKTLSLLTNKPIHAINHLHSHLEAVHMTEKVSYPYLGVLVSGGHSAYQLVESPTKFTLLGTTIDDAAGEAFDKGGKILGLGYPAGKIIDEFAVKGDAKRFSFPIGLQGSKDAMLSYSGVKTALRNFVETHKELDLNPSGSQDMYDVCAAYQDAIIRALDLKLRYALEKAKETTGAKKLQIVVGGGVAANSGLRNLLKKRKEEVFFVKPLYCTDNAAMIANYALRTYSDAHSFPECLDLDAMNRFIEKPRKHS